MPMQSMKSEVLVSGKSIEQFDRSLKINVQSDMR